MELDEPESIQSTVRGRLFKGAGAQAFSQAVWIAVRVAEVPLLLSFWGQDLYGEWLMVTAIPTYLAMADVGFAGAAGRDMAIRVGGGDRLGALSVFQSAWLFLFFVSLVVALLASVVVVIVPLGSWLHLEVITGNDLSAVVLILTANVLVGFQSGLLYGGYCSVGRYGTGMFLTAATYLMEFGGLALAVAMGGGPVEASCGFLAGRMVGIVLKRAVLWRVVPWIRYGLRQASSEHVTRLVRPAIASMAFPLGNILNIQGIRLMVGIMLGPASVVAFTTLSMLSRFGLLLARSVSSIIEPELGFAFGKRDYILFRQIIRRSCQVAWWASLATSLVLCLAGENLLKVWTGGHITMEWILYFLLILAAVVNTFWFTAFMAAHATNRYGRIALIYSIVYGIGGLILAYLGTKAAGLTGTGVALVLVEVAIAVYVIPTVLRLSEDSWAPWLRTVLQPPWFLLRRLRT